MLNEEKREALYKKGIEEPLFVPFDYTLKNMSAYDFCDDILIKKLKTKVLILGEDARFGSERLVADRIKEYMNKKNVDVHIVPLIIKDDIRVSSSLIRNLILEGKVEIANKYLGRNFKISGKVVSGKKRGGSKLGFPTANINAPQNQIIPQSGVYATIVNCKGRVLKGATNVGKNPTFGENGLSIETYILDFNEDIYGECIQLEFIKKIRDEIKFENVEDLISQMKSDVEIISSGMEEFLPRGLTR